MSWRHPTEQDWDRARDLQKHEPSPRHQKLEVVKLVGYCNGLIIGGMLDPAVATGLHNRIRAVCTEFGIDAPPPLKGPVRIA